MYELALEVTNLCNRDCIHCMRNKADAMEVIPLELVAALLPQARDLGMKAVSLTGGEISLYPDLPDLLDLITDFGFQFNLVTNGYRFKDRLLPLLLQPKVRGKVSAVGFSLDGARAETHDALRGKGSFKEVMEGAALCKMTGISLSFKSLINNFNKDELLDLAFLGATLSAANHHFIYPFPVPRSIRSGILLSPEELHTLSLWVTQSLGPAFKTTIEIDGYSCSQEGTLFNCGLNKCITVDYHGNLILCCNLSHATAEAGIPTTFGEECLGNLKDLSLKEGIIRHFHAAARLVEARLEHLDRLTGVNKNLCFWCLTHFGKFDWLRNYPDSPWAEGVLQQS
jgi:MoaA/NifB/PqqE/SkfB family radical SAM enzyme